MTTDLKLYTIERFLTKEIVEGKLNINRILSKELDGFIVPDFLSADEISLILTGFRSLSDSELVHINNAFNSYPMSFAQFEQMVKKNIITEEDYYSFSKNYIQDFESKFGFNVHSKLKSLLNKIVGAPELEIPQNGDGTGRYVPFTFRELFPGEGNLKAHCENLFYQEFPGFFEKINAFSTLENQLSFFIVLQSPGSGGELTLFDVLWNDAQKRLGDTEIKLEDGTVLAFDDTVNLKREYIPPQTGSLVIFSGGNIWHRVETVRTAPSRITLGGFLSFSHDGKKLYSWS